MTLPRDEIVKGIRVELANFGALIRSLDAAEWVTPSRCDGWTVGDVAAHVVGGMADVVAGNFDGLGTPEVTAREVEERRGRTPDEVADELDMVAAGAAALLDVFDDESWNGPAPAGLAGTVASGVEALWYDAYLHGDDIRAAIARPPEGGEGLKAAVSHVTDILTGNGWRPATVDLEGLDPFQISGGGPIIGGDPLTFVLVATGRAEPESLGLDASINIYP